MECAHCGHTHWDENTQTIDIDHCPQCREIMDATPEEDQWDVMVCVDFDH